MHRLTLIKCSALLLASAEVNAWQFQERDYGYEAVGAHPVDPNSPDHADNFHLYTTSPEIAAPRWDITVYDRDALAPGYWFVAPYQDVTQSKRGGNWVGPHIYDQTGELVWSGVPALGGWDVFGFTKRGNIDGEDLLSFSFRHHYSALWDNSYQEVQRIYVDEYTNRTHLNMHEFAMVDSGTRILQMKTKAADATREMSAEIGYEGNCSYLAYGFEERRLDIREKTFDWFAEGVIPLADTIADNGRIQKFCSNQYDYLHCNSLDKFPDGDYLIGCKNPNIIYKISGKDGSIVWRFSGSDRSRTDFEFDDHFAGQHDVKIWDVHDNIIHLGMLDNAWTFAGQSASNDCSRGLLLTLDTDKMTAKLITEYPHPQGEVVHGRGSFQLLPNGNVFIGFAQHSFIAEYSRNGTLLMEGKVRPDVKSYRAYKFPWRGHPIDPPNVYSVAVAYEDTYMTEIFISWNGATEVATWNVHRADSITYDPGELIVSTAKTGFETGLTYDGYVGYVVVVALDASGDEIGRSAVAATTNPRPTGLSRFTSLQIALISVVVVCTALVLLVMAYRYCTPILSKKDPAIGSKQTRELDELDSVETSEHNHLLEPFESGDVSDLEKEDIERSDASSHNSV